MDRASTFSDPTIIERLRTQFVPYAGECQEVYRRESALRGWFVPMASAVNPRLARGETAQGMYVAGADGSAYGWYHQRREPQLVLDFMDAAMRKYRENPPKEAAISKESIRTARMVSPDPTTSVVRIFSRLRPLPPNPNVIERGAGRDHLWVYANEVRAMAAAAEKGEPFAMPAALALRIARFHLVDNVRGQPRTWAADAVRKAAVTMRPAATESGLRVLTFSGDFDIRTTDDKHGIEARIEGELQLDPSSARIRRFRAYAEGQAWGDQTWQAGRGRPRERYPLVFAMVDADDSVARTLPPAALYYGAPYDRPAGEPAR